MICILTGILGQISSRETSNYSSNSHRQGNFQAAVHAMTLKCITGQCSVNILREMRLVCAVEESRTMQVLLLMNGSSFNSQHLSGVIYAC